MTSTGAVDAEAEAEADELNCNLNNRINDLKRRQMARRSNDVIATATAAEQVKHRRTIRDLIAVDPVKIGCLGGPMLTAVAVSDDGNVGSDVIGKGWNDDAQPDVARRPTKGRRATTDGRSDFGEKLDKLTVDLTEKHLHEFLVNDGQTA